VKHSGMYSLYLGYVITSVGHTDTKLYYQCGVLIDSTDGATLLSKVLAQTN